MALNDRPWDDVDDAARAHEPIPLPRGADPDDQHEPYMVLGSGPHLLQDWLLEADATAYRVTVVFNVGGQSGEPGSGFVLVACNIAGGEESLQGRMRHPRWPVDGGGAFYRFAVEGFLAAHYVAEKFRLNEVDAYHVTRLIATALGRPWQ